MIVLLLSSVEAASLLAGKADEALRQYVAGAMRMEALLPDSNLPEAVLLRRVELVNDGRDYAAVVRLYDTSAAADRAWTEVEEAVTEREPSERSLFAAGGA